MLGMADGDGKRVRLVGALGLGLGEKQAHHHRHLLFLAVADGGDHGRPVALGEGPAAEAFRSIARVMIDEVVPPADLAGCSARLLGAVDAALAAADAAAADAAAAAAT